MNHREKQRKSVVLEPSRSSSTSGTIRGRRVLVARLCSTQRPHRPGAGRPIRPHQEPPGDAEIPGGDDRSRGDIVIVHGRFSDSGSVNWIAADILRIDAVSWSRHWTSSKTKPPASNRGAAYRCSGRIPQ